MKKRIIVIGALLLAATCCGCGAKGSDPGKAKELETSASPEGAMVEAQYGSIQEYVDSEEHQTQLNALRESLSGSGMSVDMKAEQNVLVYVYRYDSMESGAFSQENLDALNQGLEEKAPSFQAVAEALKENTREKDPVVRVQYVSSDDKVLVTRDFSLK